MCVRAVPALGQPVRGSQHNCCESCILCCGHSLHYTSYQYTGSGEIKLHHLAVPFNTSGSSYHLSSEDRRQCHSYFQYEEKVESRVPAWDGEGGLAANPAHPSLRAARRMEEEAELQPRPGGRSYINAGIPATHPHFKVTRNISAETGTSGGPQTPPQCDDGHQADYSETKSTKR